MRLRAHQISTISFLAALLLCVPWVASAFSIESTLWSLVISFFGLFVGLAGLLLDVALNQFVIGFGEMFLSDLGIGRAVNDTWVIIRDLFNITFIFGLVFIGFKMILGSDETGTRRWLVSLILAALLVNFSLLITKTVVDFTNILATQIANGFDHSVALKDKVNAVEGNPKITISESFMNKLGLTGILGAKDMLENSSGGGYYGFIFGVMILFIVMIFVFAAGGILLLIRFAVLCLYMILSPLMFLGWVFPQLQSYSSKYWKGFLGRAFFAPIYVLLVYISLEVLNGIYNTSGATDYKGSLTAASGRAKDVPAAFADTFPPFILACVFLIASIVVAQKLGADGASATIKMGRNAANWGRSKVQRGAGAATAGSAAWALRNTAGRAAHAYANSAAAKTRGRSFLGKQLLTTSRKVAKSSFDARNIGGVGKSLGVGTGQTGGFTKTVDDRVKAEQAFAKSIHATRDENDPAYIAEKAKKKEEIERAAAANAEVKQHGQTTVKEARNKNSEQLDAAIQEAEQRKQELDKLYATAKQEARSKGGLTYTQDILHKKEIDKKTQEIESLKYIQERKKKEAEVNKAASDGKITRDQQIEQIADIEREYQALEDSLSKQAGASRLMAESAETYAKSALEFANELEYINQLERSRDMWGNVNAKLSGGSVGAGAFTTAGAYPLLGSGVLASAGLAGVTAVGYAAPSAYAYQTNAAIEALKREYGEHGSKASKKEKRKKEYQAQQEANKDLVDDNKQNSNNGNDTKE